MKRKTTLNQIMVLGLFGWKLCFLTNWKHASCDSCHWIKEIKEKLLTEVCEGSSSTPGTLNPPHLRVFQNFWSQLFPLLLVKMENGFFVVNCQRNEFFHFRLSWTRPGCPGELVTMRMELRWLSPKSESFVVYTSLDKYLIISSHDIITFLSIQETEAICRWVRSSC